ncbi:MAG: histone deacetylase [Firmicutes bacterium]|nr:histone deacetylase [Bacillota bacterium]
MKKRLVLVYHPDYLIHTQGQHPERKERLEYILSAYHDQELDKIIDLHEPDPASIADLQLIHDPAYIKSVEEACLAGRRSLDMDTYLVPESYRVALLSAGGVLAGLKMIMDGDSDRVFVLNRPPGHHAEYDQAMGFCLFNNVAIAAAKAFKDYSLQRIAIIDWDVHHGNGTQHSFEEDSRLLFISTHQSPAYPGSGNKNENGRGEGEGFTVNLPLPSGCGDAEYELCFKDIIVPILDQFKPELVIISAGQDAYHLDPLAGMGLTDSGYYMMAKSLAAVADRWAGGRMLLCLEGGYHLQGQAGAVIQVLNAIGELGLPIPGNSPLTETTARFQDYLEEIKVIQKKYWKL